MAEKSKKVVMKVGLDITGAKKELENLSQSISKSTKELKQIDKALKLDPKNTTLLAQKAKVLQETLAKTQEKSQKLKQALSSLKASGVSENSAEFRKLEREIVLSDEAAKKLSKTLASLQHNKIADIGEKFQKLGQKTRVLSAAAAGATAGVFALAKKAGAAADDLNTLSKVTGISTEELQKMAFASDLVDVSVEDVAKSMSKLQKNIGEAEKGSKSATAAFSELGVSWKNSDGSFKDGKQVFDEVINALHNVEDTTKRNSLAMDLMGKSAMNLNPLIIEGADAFRQVADSAKGILTQEQLDNANKFNDSLDLIKAQSKQTALQLGAMFAGDFQAGAAKAQKAIVAVADAATKISPGMRSAFVTSAGAISLISPALTTVGTTLRSVDTIASMTAKTFSLLKKGGSFAKDMVVELPELISWLKTVTVAAKNSHLAFSLFSKAKSWFTGLNAIFPIITANLATIGAGAKVMWMALTGPVGIAIAAVAAVGAAIVVLYNKCAWFRNAINAFWSAIVSGVSAVVGAIQTVISWIGAAISKAREFFGMKSKIGGDGGPNPGPGDGRSYGPAGFVPQLATGTDFVEKSGYAVIHGGEAVVTKTANSKFDYIADKLLTKIDSLGGGGTKTIELVVNLDGQTVAKKIHRLVSENQAGDLRRAKI